MAQWTDALHLLRRRPELEEASQRPSGLRVAEEQEIQEFQEMRFPDSNALACG